MLEILEPTLILDEQIAKKNLRNMWAKCQDLGISFRPHFKTHQSLHIGHWFKDLGVSKITVSSLRMAEKFATDWNDILVAFPVNILEGSRIRRLSEKISLSLVIENQEAVDFLNDTTEHEINIFLKIDAGYGRTGVAWNQTRTIRHLLQSVAQTNKLNLTGLLIHSGHAYKSPDQVIPVLESSLMRIDSLRKEFFQDFPDLIISYGDTPTCSLGTSFPGVDEFRPGNFIFYDLHQSYLGACSTADIAVCMACPVVAIHPARNEIVIHGGAVHFSKDSLTTNQGISFGQVAKNLDQKWGNPIPGAYLKSLSQEHGIVKIEDSKLLNTIKVGDLLYILPVHSCLSIDAMGGYYGWSGDYYTI